MEGREAVCESEGPTSGISADVSCVLHRDITATETPSGPQRPKSKLATSELPFLHTWKGPGNELVFFDFQIPQAWNFLHSVQSHYGTHKAQTIKRFLQRKNIERRVQVSFNLELKDNDHQKLSLELSSQALNPLI